MTAQHATCPPEAALADFGLGKLDAASAESVSQHLETCADCRQRVASLSGDSFVTRPVVTAKMLNASGESVSIRFLVDSGGDRS